MSNLFNIIEELDRVFFDIETNEGELTDNLEDRLSIVEEDFADKLNAYGHYIKQLVGNNAVLKDEIQMFKNRIDANINKVEKLKEALLFAVTKFGEPKSNGMHGFKTESRTFWTQQSKSVNLDDEFSHSEYTKYSIDMLGMDIDELHTMIDIANDNSFNFETVATHDKKAIKTVLNSGETIEGAELISKTGIRIR